MSSEETERYSNDESEMYNIINQLIEHILNNKNANISKQDEIVLKSWNNGDRLSLREKYRVEFQDKCKMVNGLHMSTDHSANKKINLLLR